MVCNRQLIHDVISQAGSKYYVHVTFACATAGPPCKIALNPGREGETREGQGGSESRRGRGQVQVHLTRSIVQGCGSTSEGGRRGLSAAVPHSTSDNGTLGFNRVTFHIYRATSTRFVLGCANSPRGQMQPEREIAQLGTSLFVALCTRVA